MRKVIILIAGLALAAAAPMASAAIVNPVVDFGSGFALEGTRLVDDQTSTAGDVLTIVGFVADFNEPFDDLDPNDPTKEYTFVYSGLVSQGTVVSGGGAFIFYDTQYTGGTLRVYCDTNLNADYANPGTFADGDMILEASLSDFLTSTKSFNCSGTLNTDLQFIGGSLFNRVSLGGIGFDGIATGLFSVCNSFVDDPREAEGYFGLADTKVDVIEPVPVEQKSWGEIKKGGE